MSVGRKVSSGIAAVALAASTFVVIAAAVPANEAHAGPARAAKVPRLSVSNVTVVEGDKGKVKAIFVVRLSKPSSRPVTVGFKTKKGTAKTPSDFLAKKGTLRIPAGRLSKRIKIKVKGDPVVEKNETFTVKLRKPVGAKITRRVGVGTIKNDDKAGSAAKVTLSVGTTGAGAGTITSATSGISCPTNCAQDYAKGAEVTLTATAAPGSVFTGWAGACTGTGPCVVTMSANKSAGADFAEVNPTLRALTVALTGTTKSVPDPSVPALTGTLYARGTVTSAPAGIACRVTVATDPADLLTPPDCAENYVGGTLVTLTAAAGEASYSLLPPIFTASGVQSTFTGWGGACAARGTQLTCTVTMDQARSVTAGFGLPA